MPSSLPTLRCSLLSLCVIVALLRVTASACIAADPPDRTPESQTTSNVHHPSLQELKRTGLQRSRFQKLASPIRDSDSSARPQANLQAFNENINPLFEEYCIDCHGTEVQEGNIQLTALDPDLLRGSDTEWWTEVFAVVTKEEMPPPDYIEMDEVDRQAIVEWLSSELQSASEFRRGSGAISSFRRLTRYEYNYALQDLLGLPWDFAKDLPPEPKSDDGFQNSAELLHLSVTQFETYHRLAREALDRVTVEGERPKSLFWGIAMQAAADREWPKQDEKIEKLKKQFADDPEKLQAELDRAEDQFQQPHRAAYYKQLSTGRTAKAEWSYHGARYAFAPSAAKPEFPADSDCVAILPAVRNQKLTIELGNQLPDEGTMRVKVRASRINSDDGQIPSLQLWFGWRASNEGRALIRVSKQDIPVAAEPDHPQIIQWDVPLGEIYPRNSVRKTSPMGALPSPSEYIRIANSSAAEGDIQIDFVSVEAPVYEQWPPESHRRIFTQDHQAVNELQQASQIFRDFMTRAWGRPVTKSEVDRKLKLFEEIRPACGGFQEAVLEVLATVLSSPQFIYVTRGLQLGDASQSQAAPSSSSPSKLEPNQLAKRLTLFLWCSSIPDRELVSLAESGQLFEPEVLTSQVDRMLADPRSHRFAQHFVHQWLDMELLEFTNFKQHLKNFDPLLKEAMQQEPVALFEDILQHDASVLDFIHSDYALLNERLARHYGVERVQGNHFRRIELDGDFKHGGLLTQAGLLAMNSDWPDSHPLKRAIWLLESLLADPPPPPPPAVPQIDLADPEIAKMTLKERIEDHRNQAACRSCHIKIDPWGIAFENFDALGQWRDEIRGKPVDASSDLFNDQTLDGMQGLKRFLLQDRQDQFIQATVQKLATYALGRSLRFEDRAEIEWITSEVRRNGDGLKTMIHAIVNSDLFQSE